MRKLILSAAVSAAFVGAALAQVGASSGMYVIDLDPARYAGPASQRLALRVGDQPRHVTFSDKEEVCVQLHRETGQNDVISARIRTLTPESQVANVRVVAPDISPGTYRSTPWGMLVRATPQAGDSAAELKEAPVCTM